MKPTVFKIQLMVIILLFIGLGTMLYLHISNEKIAYVDSTKLVNSYQGMIDARAQYQQKSTVWKANIDTLTMEVRKAIADYDQNKATMTEKEKKINQELIRTKQKQLADYQQALNEKAGLEDSQMTTKVLNEINTYLKKYGDKNGYKAILVATQYGNIAYADEGMDITEVILEGLNKQYNGN